MYIVLLVIVSYLQALHVESVPVKRLVLHDEQSVADKIHSFEATVAQLNASLMKEIAANALLNASLIKEVAELKAAIQAEKTERCQVGTASFSKLQCEPGHTEYFPCHLDNSIKFNPSFSKIPSVIYAFEKLDVDANHNLRIYASVSHVTTAGATLTVTTWADTRLTVSGLSWIACPSI